MPLATSDSVGAPPPPRVRLSLAVTGHRIDNAAYAANRARVAKVVHEIFDAIEAVVAAEPRWLGPDCIAPTRLHCLLADGVDQLTCDEALARDWELVAPLPFGERVNCAISAKPKDAAEARAILAGEPPKSAQTRANAKRLYELGAAARVFALADQDELIAKLYLDKLDHPDDGRADDTFSAHCSERARLAARVMLEQSDILIGVWDGVSQAFIGGTGHTIAVALRMGAPVVWVDAKAPETWRILRTVESLVGLIPDADEDRDATLASLVRQALRPAESQSQHDHRHVQSDGGAAAAARALEAETWRPRSDPLWHAYRRVEALFCDDHRPFRSLRQTYESPNDVTAGGAAETLAAMRSLPGVDPKLIEDIEVDVLRRFAWSDGVSARLSDAYRGGMTVNFLLSAAAIISSMAYLPFLGSNSKPVFATVEVFILGAILFVTWLGQRQHWHARWFETRRVAEYFRHGPILLALGVSRSPGRWPKGAETSWPEWYARYGLREVGLPRCELTRLYLRRALEDLLDNHVIRQRDYHAGKAHRLTNVHHNLDDLSSRMFELAVVSVASTLLLLAAQTLALLPVWLTREGLQLMTFLSGTLPTFGSAVTGIRYFGDFERFAAISEVTAEKLNAVHVRIKLLLAAPDQTLEYGLVSDLVHATDDVVVTEIESWQAVFGGKAMTVPG